MIEIHNTEVSGWEAAVRGMRNPMNSWEKSDSHWYTEINTDPVYYVGDNDLSLMKKLIAAGTDHSKFMRMINVTADVTAPLYWWKEYDTYKVGTVANSCSTMHKIAAKEFTLDDFSHEKLINSSCMEIQEQNIRISPMQALLTTIECLNSYRNLYLETKDKKYWWQMIQLLPSSYNQKRTVQLNYAVLRNIYHSRKDHKLDEWRKFCSWIEELPYYELMTE
jgi:hypothetical protein